MMSEKQIQSYVWHKGECFFVSTIERDSSAMLNPGRYNETFVYKCHPQDIKGAVNADYGQQVYQGSGPTGSATTHIWVVNALYETGKPPVEELE